MTQFFLCLVVVPVSNNSLILKSIKLNLLDQKKMEAVENRNDCITE